jgi:hypothetical protein
VNIFQKILERDERSIEFACAKLMGCIYAVHSIAGQANPQRGQDMNTTHAAHVRREFYKAVRFYLHVVWPIFSILLFVIVLFGLIISYLEGWNPFDGIYFAFVTGLTIGYGELVPKLAVSRILAILLGFNGVLMTAIFAAISIRAIETAVRVSDQVE